VSHLRRSARVRPDAPLASPGGPGHAGAFADAAALGRKRERDGWVPGAVTRAARAHGDGGAMREVDRAMVEDLASSSSR